MTRVPRPEGALPLRRITGNRSEHTGSASVFGYKL